MKRLPSTNNLAVNEAPPPHHPKQASTNETMIVVHTEAPLFRGLEEENTRLTKSGAISL